VLGTLAKLVRVGSLMRQGAKRLLLALLANQEVFWNIEAT